MTWIASPTSSRTSSNYLSLDVVTGLARQVHLLISEYHESFSRHRIYNSTAWKCSTLLKEQHQSYLENEGQFITGVCVFLVVSKVAPRFQSWFITAHERTTWRFGVLSPPKFKFINQYSTCKFNTIEGLDSRFKFTIFEILKSRIRNYSSSRFDISQVIIIRHSSTEHLIFNTQHL